MAHSSILPAFPRLKQQDVPFWRVLHPAHRSPPTTGWCPLSQDFTRLPRYVQQDPVAKRYWHFLSPLAWEHFPERDLSRNWGQPTVPMGAFAAAALLKLELGLRSWSLLRTFLVDHPALVWLLGFSQQPQFHPGAFDPEACLPTARHFTRLLRKTPNTRLQFLLDETVRLLQTELSTQTSNFGHAISLDTKHILAWVQENNPKAYVKEGYVKTQQPKGDLDCRLGCKRRHNRILTPPTPQTNPVSASTISVGEFYWGYASGVVATKVPQWGEFVLAELTQPFNCPDVSYFFPLLTDTERRLGFRPLFGAFDAAFDSFYVYAHFHRVGEPWETAFAAVPLTKRGPRWTFDPAGLPLCRAGLAMPLKSTFICGTRMIEHERGRYACPLRYPHPIADVCPIDDQHWSKGGCIVTLPTSIGARLRHQIDRESALYKTVYRQRTATERINSQAKALGIERPYLRNQQAITNQNTLIYVLINLRAVHRIRRRKATQD
jgi:hypothetical protein